MPGCDPVKPDTQKDNDPARLTVVEPVTCLLCGCLCDDLMVTTEDGRVREVENGCEFSDEWLRRDRPAQTAPIVAETQGIPVSAGEGARRAAELLLAAKAPIILGLSFSTNEAAQAALALADEVGAAVELGDRRASLAKVLAFQRVGRVSATLGEVKDRADVVVFWGADPVESHPRHWQRYSVEPRGRFIPGGRAGRTVIVVDHERTATAERADQFVAIDERNEFEVLWTLRALLRGVALDEDRVHQTTGSSVADLNHLAKRLREARYGAWFHGGISRDEPLARAAQTIEAATLLVRDLNRQTRFVMLGMGAPGNTSGVESVLTWQAGFSSSVDFGAGHPESLPLETSAHDRLSRGEADMVIIVGEVWYDQFSREAVDQLEKAPMVVISPAEQGHLRVPDVRLIAALPGWNDAGTVTRADGLMLPLRQLRPAQQPYEGDWLKAVLEQVRLRKRKTNLEPSSSSQS